MSKFLVLFRLNHDATYSDRWGSVVQAIQAEAESGVTWDKMTSGILLSSAKDQEALATAIQVNSAFIASKDTLMVFDVTQAPWAIRGDAPDLGTLHSLTRTNNVLAERSLQNALYPTSGGLLGDVVTTSNALLK